MAKRHALFPALLPVVAVALVFGLNVYKAAAMDMHHHHGAHVPPATSASTKAYQQAMQTMHQQMAQPLSGNADVDFVRQMIPHHQAAVEMAKVQLAYGKDENLKHFSRWIITVQEQEIGFMQNWLRGHDNGAARADARDYYGEAMETMHHAMMIDYTGDADVDFVRGMIPHHQGAVDMAAILIPSGINPEIRALAEGVYRSQLYEIAWQHHWLDQRNDSSSFPSFIL